MKNTNLPLKSVVTLYTGEIFRIARITKTGYIGINGEGTRAPFTAGMIAKVHYVPAK